MADWFRRKTWTKLDEEDFFTKIRKARKGGRSQYLRIQAIELIDTKDTELIEIAEKLLLMILTEYPDDDFERSTVLNSLGKIYELKNNYAVAIEYYKQSVDFEKIYPKITTTSYLNLLELIAKTNKTL